MDSKQFLELRLRLVLNQLTVDERLMLSECMRLVGEKMELRDREFADSFDERYPKTEEIFDAPAVKEAA